MPDAHTRLAVRQCQRRPNPKRGRGRALAPKTKALLAEHVAALADVSAAACALQRAIDRRDLPAAERAYAALRCLVPDLGHTCHQVDAYLRRRGRTQKAAI